MNERMEIYIIQDMNKNILAAFSDVLAADKFQFHTRAVKTIITPINIDDYVDDINEDNGRFTSENVLNKVFGV